MASQQRASGIFGRAQSFADRVINRGTRQSAYDNINTLFRDQPFLASFLAAQVILCFLPIALFLSFAISVLLVSFISALFFSIFWIGIALLILVPTLLVTTSLALGIWIWGASSFVLARRIYNFLAVSKKGSVEVGFPQVKKVVIEKNGGGYGDANNANNGVMDGT